MDTVAEVMEDEPRSAPVLGRDLAWLLSQAGHALMTQQTAALEQLGIGPRGYCVMVTADTGELSQTAIARQIGLDKTTMVVTIDALEQAGLVERQPSKTDRRAHVIVLSKAGRRKVAQAQTIIARLESDVLGTLSKSGRESLIESLGALVSGPLSSPSACSTPVRRRT